MLEMIDVWLWSLHGNPIEHNGVIGKQFLRNRAWKDCVTEVLFRTRLCQIWEINFERIERQKTPLYSRCPNNCHLCNFSRGEGHAVDAHISRCTFRYCLRTNSFIASDSFLKDPDHETPVMSLRPFELLFFHRQQPSTEPVQQVFRSRELTSPQRCPFVSSYEIWLEGSLGHHKHPLIVLKSRQNRWFEQGGMSAEYS